MKKFLSILFLLTAVTVYAADSFQVPNANFDDWSGAKFDDQEQPAQWSVSNVEQKVVVTVRFNFAHKETGRSGSALSVGSQYVGAGSVGENSPGYATLGKTWMYFAGVGDIDKSSAGTMGGIAWTHRPDSISMWIKRTGSDADKENYNIVYYAWNGTAKGNKFTAKNGTCVSIDEKTDEESNVRIALDGSECGVLQSAHQVCEGWLCERKVYNDWVKKTIPIYYFDSTLPEKMNIILSGSNYPNLHDSKGIYDGNRLWVDDIELIYSSKIQKLKIDGFVWEGFDSDTEEIQYYGLGESATSIPEIIGIRGAGSMTNNAGTTATFNGRELTASEMSVTKGDLENTPTVITVKSEDGKSTSTYRIQFRRAASSNAKLSGISYTYKDMSGNDVEASVSGFNVSKYKYTVELPYGTTSTPTVSVTKQEEAQTFAITQPTSVTGTATIVVTAADGAAQQTYTVEFKVGQLKDNTLKGIKVNDKPVAGFTPSQTIYKVSLPVGTSTLKVEAESNYPSGAQTIVITPNPLPTGDAINGSTVQISVTTPGDPIAKIYKLNIKLEASSYSYLSDLKVEGFDIQFQPTTTTYSVALPMGTSSLPKIEYTAGDEYQKIVMDSSAGIDGTTLITVTAGNGTDQTIYKIVFSTQKSTVSTLNGIKIGGTDLPGFSPTETSYTYTLPVGTETLPTIEAVPHDEYQTIQYSFGGVNGKTRITVKAGDGSTTIYSITFSVATFSDNTLKGLYLNGNLIEGFEPTKNDYVVNMPEGSTQADLPAVTFVLNDTEFQKASEPQWVHQNGEHLYKVTIRPQTGESRTYTIRFTIAKSDNNKLEMIYVEGAPLPEFDPAVLTYTYSLPMGVSTIPAVTWKAGDAKQSIKLVVSDRERRIIVTAENGAKNEYKISFIITASTNAQLEMIYLDGTPLKDFRKDSLNYTYQLAEGATCPVITVEKAPGQQVSISTPYAAGLATIEVKPGAGESNVYTILFETVAAPSVQLKDILVNGVSLPNFDPAQSAYTAHFQGALPTVVGVAKDATQTVLDALWQNNVAWVHVSDEDGNHASYQITFTRDLASVDTLAAILVNGTPRADFQADKLDYTDHLPAGSDYPTIGYNAGDPTQTIYFGQIGDGKWQIIVTAENGAQKVYTVQYIIDPYDDATLKSLTVEGKTIAFAPTTFVYNLNLDEGASLPNVTYEAREGQVVLSHNDGDSTMVYVTAHSGAFNKYVVRYTRQKNANALLADLIVNGTTLAGFDPNTFKYEYKLGPTATVVPTVFPVAQVSNQTITTYFCRPNGKLEILVEAQDGINKNTYTIDFPVILSDNAKLGDLLSGDSRVSLVPAFDPEVTDYTITMLEGDTACAPLTYEPAEKGQLIDIISRPLGKTTEITVTAPNGVNKTTYRVEFKPTWPSPANRLAKIHIDELDSNLVLDDNAKRDFIMDLPYGSRKMTVTFEKNYDEQTVFVQPGGVYNPTILTVKSNRPGEADEVYTITPKVSTQNPAVLESITVNSAPLPNFDPNRFSYVVNVNAEPTMDYTAAEGVNVVVMIQTNKHWQVKVSSHGFENIYHLWYYYPNDVIPNGEFDDWSATTKYNGKKKPAGGWNVIADAADKYLTQKSGDELEEDPSGVAHLKTRHSFMCARTIPAFMTLGTITGSLGTTNNFSYSGSIPFHNSPDTFLVYYKATDVYTKNRIRLEMWGSGGNSFVEHNDETEVNEFTRLSMPLAELNAAVGSPTSMNILLNSAQDETGKMGGSLVTPSDLYVDWVRFSYNHKLTGMTVNGKAADRSGNAFSFALADSESERIEKPDLSFIGEVADQAQLITWTDTIRDDADYEIYNATIRNFAENGTDYSDYTFQYKRPWDTNNQLADLIIDSLQIEGFAPDKTDYTIKMKATRYNMNDIIPVAASSLQKITTSFADSTYTITVTPEKGAATVYKVKFVTPLSDDVTLKSLTAEGVSYVPEQKDYDVTAKTMPLITFEKQSDLQTVSVVNGLITITAENGATGTYHINRIDPALVLGNAQLKEFVFDGNDITGFGLTNFNYSAARPDNVTFARVTDNDSVVFVQTIDSMVWHVFGNVNEKYKLTYATASANTNLANIVLNGKDYSEFDAAETEYEILSDTTICFEALAAEEGQTLTTVREVSGETITYEVTVTAPNGVDTKTYRLRVAKPKSDVKTLAGIYVDGDLIDGFRPDSLNYIIILPSVGAKKAEPQMPLITYELGAKGQNVQITPGKLNIDPTLLKVSSAKDAAQITEYEVLVQSEPSHCTDLSGIIVNGEPIGNFQPERHFYSISLESADFTLDYTSEDHFQKPVTPVVTPLQGDGEYLGTFHVEAEDGTTADYLIEIYVKSKSSDAQLANILLDNKNFTAYCNSISMTPALTFEPSNSKYVFNLPSSLNGELPTVNAQLKMEGQTVQIEPRKDTILVHVTAQDGIAKTTYTLCFQTHYSDNMNLQMISYVVGQDTIDVPSFDPKTASYEIVLEEGIRVLPEVIWKESEPMQQVDSIWDTKNQRVEVIVKAEDKTEKSYFVRFQFTPSAADTLSMIYEVKGFDRTPIKGFQPHTFAYVLDTLAVGKSLPKLEYDSINEWQKIATSIEEEDQDTMIVYTYRFVVTAENGNQNTYSVTYAIRNSTVDTLKMIYIDEKELESFSALKEEYFITLTIKEADSLANIGVKTPEVTWEEGDEYQTVTKATVADSQVGKSLGYTTILTVTPASGEPRIYTIHYLIEKSKDATLLNILVGGKDLAAYNPEKPFKPDQPVYTLPLEIGASIPDITPVLKEATQTYQKSIDGDVVTIVVWAEDTNYSNVYKLIFTRELSGNTQLKDIILRDEEGNKLPPYLFIFYPENYSATINLDDDATKTAEQLLPSMEIVLAEPQEQTWDSVHTMLPNGDLRVTITVTSPNGEQGAYELTFHFVKPSDALLTAIYTNGLLLNGFHPNVTDYEYKLPYGATAADSLTLENVTFELSDTLATAVTEIDENGTISITVMAQDGTTENIYTIYQISGADSNNDLLYIFVGNDTITVKQDTIFYTYLLRSGEQTPAVEAEAVSENAKIGYEQAIQAGDTCTITVEAADGSRKKYFVYFVEAFNPGQDATSDDVIIRRAGDAPQLFVGTIRQAVSFALFDQYGHLAFLSDVPVASPNFVEMYESISNMEILVDVHNNNEGLVINVIPGQLYFYAFYSAGDKLIKSGKIIVK